MTEDALYLSIKKGSIVTPDSTLPSVGVIIDSVLMKSQIQITTEIKEQIQLTTSIE